MKRGETLVALLSMAVTVVAVEASTRLLEPRIPAEPGKWPRREMAAKYEQMRKLAARGETVEVVFVGNSTTVHGIDPVQYTKMTARNSYNAAFAGGSPRTIALWTLEVVEPLLSPEVVVLGIQSRDLNHNGAVQAALHRSFMRSPGYGQLAGGPLQGAEGYVERASAFIRNRRAFRRPVHLMRHILEVYGEERDPRHGVTGPSGRRMAKWSRPYKVPKGWEERQRTETLNDYRFGGEELRALIRLRKELRDRKVSLVLVSMPVTSDYVKLHPQGHRDMTKFERVIRGIAARIGVPLVAASDAFSSTEPFKDPVHLDAVGRIAFTGQMAGICGFASPGQVGFSEVRLADVSGRGCKR